MGFFRSSRSRLRFLLAFSREDYWILGKAWILLLVTELGLRTVSLQRTQQLLRHPKRDAESVPETSAPVTAARLGRLVDLAGRHHLLTVRCLSRALVLQWLLGQRGFVTELQIGVQRECDTICAHAWLEVDGQVIGEPRGGSEGFARLVRARASR